MRSKLTLLLALAVALAVVLSSRPNCAPIDVPPLAMPDPGALVLLALLGAGLLARWFKARRDPRQEARRRLASTRARRWADDVQPPSRRRRRRSDPALPFQRRRGR